MVARIALGVKCSKSIMGLHLSGNPGVTPDVKSFLIYKMKAYDPLDEKESCINN